MLSVQTINAVILECDFRVDRSSSKPVYFCFAVNFQTFANDRNVTAIQGIHLDNKTNDDVELLMVQKQFCPYLPIQLGDHFKNLKSFNMMDSNVRHLKDNDLDGLDKLEVFSVSHNPIEKLNANFFKGHSTIQTISFYNCHLKIIDSKALDPLTNLKEAFFDENYCIDMKSKGNFTKLKIEIAEKCQKHNSKHKVFETHNDHQCSNQHKSSFIRRNCYFFISFFCTLSLAFCVVLVKISRKSTRKQWSELNFI
jgi:Leucine-rich repeat (LRR) protein